MDVIKIVNDALFSSGKNDWETPQDLFDELDAEFHFTLDPCATNQTAKCKKYYTEKENGLLQDWTGETVFCNPPYSDVQQTAWVKKCYEHGLQGGGRSHAHSSKNRYKAFSRLHIWRSRSSFFERPAQIWQ